MNKPKRGGARPNTGPKTDRSRKIERVNVTIYQDQKDKLKTAGGSKAVREWLDKLKSKGSK